MEEAVSLLRTAVHHAPGQFPYQHALGRALSRLPHSAREAVQVLERAAQLAPQNVTVLFELATIMARQGLKLRAQKTLEAALKLAPRDARLSKLAAELGVEKR